MSENVAKNLKSLNDLFYNPSGRYYDMEAKQISYDDWVTLFNSKSPDDRFIKGSKARDWYVSTVWIGQCLNSDPQGVPHIFETHVYPYNLSLQQVFEEHHSDRAIAIYRHDSIVNQILEGVDINSLG